LGARTELRQIKGLVKVPKLNRSSQHGAHRRGR
jgi:hypothetical protein